MTVPPIGRYWSSRLPSQTEPLDTMRGGATREFDNAQRNIGRTWKKYGYLIEPEYLHLATDSGLGNPPREEVAPGIMASAGSIEYAAMASQILPYFHGGHVLEIGGGYGGLASAIMRQLGSYAVEYTIVDWPEVARFSRYYLSGWPARVISPEEFGRENRSYDLVIQTRGFMEMSIEEVTWYFQNIQDGLLSPGGLFFCLNRKKKETEFKDYPFDRKWSVVSKGVWPESGWMPMVLLEREEEESDELAEVLSVLLNPGSTIAP